MYEVLRPLNATARRIGSLSEPTIIFIIFDFTTFNSSTIICMHIFRLFTSGNVGALDAFVSLMCVL